MGLMCWVLTYPTNEVYGPGLNKIRKALYRSAKRGAHLQMGEAHLSSAAICLAEL